MLENSLENKSLTNLYIYIHGCLQVPENLMREVVRNFNKLAKNLKAQETPESMAYLRILGSELGYIKANELKEYANIAFMYASIMTYQMPMEVRTFV